MRDNVVRELAVKYARYCDDKEFDNMANIMTDDVEMGAETFQTNTLEDFKQVLQMLNEYSATMHMVGNQFGEWDGDTWQGETYCLASHIKEVDGVKRNWELAIRYQDTISLIDGEYRYTRRFLNVVWEADRPLMG
jgi:hypothetical protein